MNLPLTSSLFPIYSVVQLDENEIEWRMKCLVDKDPKACKDYCDTKNKGSSSSDL